MSVGDQKPGLIRGGMTFGERCREEALPPEIGIPRTHGRADAAESRSLFAAGEVVSPPLPAVPSRNRPFDLNVDDSEVALRLEGSESRSVPVEEKLLTNSSGLIPDRYTCPRQPTRCTPTEDSQAHRPSRRDRQQSSRPEGEAPGGGCEGGSASRLQTIRARHVALRPHSGNCHAEAARGQLSRQLGRLGRDEAVLRPHNALRYQEAVPAQSWKSVLGRCHFLRTTNSLLATVSSWSGGRLLPTTGGSQTSAYSGGIKR